MFWSTLTNFASFLATTLLMWFDEQYATNALYRLLEGLQFWVLPLPFLLGYFLLYQAPEESTARSYLKWTMILYAANWSWQIALFYEKHPEEVPGGVILFFNLVGTSSGICLYLACVRLSQFCEDHQMTRWSKLAFFFGVCFSLLVTIHDGIQTADPQFTGEVPVFAALWSTTLYELLAYSTWATWIPLIMFHCRTLWRIPAHAELEARPKLDPSQEVPVPGSAREN